MATTGTLMTAAEFDRLPVEDGRRYELIEGELVEMPTATFLHNLIQSLLLGALQQRVRETHGVACVSTEFALGSDRYAPDIAVFVSDRWRSWELTKGPVEIIPDIAIEIISPSESAVRVESKIQSYLQHGVKEVWIFYTDPPHIYVHQRGSVRRFDAADSLSTALLPGWSLPLSQFSLVP